ncbi:16S rRNA (guanine966-N2)-methyltransferase [Spiroplasma gladiatoris]|uniref:16S rRNA (Guanine966-N2)-methyltransferase n=1 Tax=Spiroplasma gladiatoris TaxID=2143 RepID=A0A4P7AHU4_9MOLU|nr:RsmD family RNA methyltransferase [Spiroplasma gladiatoris]QBQ08025.1 16S rRNA (guanine966-N2)-methyltransferase [Spiroplasma gladiatoris]
MKVISGKYRGRVLISLEGKNTRPTTSRFKEDMFNILNNYFIFENKISLDLFAGSGALSVEGLSRGIGFAYINDLYKPALEVIKTNLKNIEQNFYQLSNNDYLSYLKYLNINNIKVDLIYLDPPYEQLEYYYNTLNYLKHSNILNNYGILIIEVGSQLDESSFDYFALLKFKKYKTKNLYVLRLEKESW